MPAQQHLSICTRRSFIQLYIGAIMDNEIRCMNVASVAEDDDQSANCNPLFLPSEHSCCQPTGQRRIAPSSRRAGPGIVDGRRQSIAAAHPTTLRSKIDIHFRRTTSRLIIPPSHFSNPVVLTDKTLKQYPSLGRRSIDHGCEYESPRCCRVQQSMVRQYA